jgi:hypothetical protein
VEHQIQRWDSKLERLTLVAMNGWIDFRDEWLEPCDGRNNIDELEEGAEGGNADISTNGRI